MVYNVEDRGWLPDRFLDVPLDTVPQGSGCVVDVHHVYPQVLFPEEAHVVALVLVDAGHAQRRGQVLGRVWAVHLGQPEDHQVEAVELGEVFLSLELPLGQLDARLQLVRLFARGAVGLVDQAGAELSKAPDVAPCGLAAHGEGQAVGAEFVDLVLLGEAGFAAAVEDVVKLGAVRTVEDAREGLWGGLAAHQAYGECTCATHSLGQRRPA